MGDYGACGPVAAAGGAAGAALSTAGSGADARSNVILPPPSKIGGPIFLENPDGTITEAIPSNQKDKCKSTSNRNSAEGDSDGSNESSEAAAASMYQEVDFLYSRHERVFSILLLTQLMIEADYDFVYIHRMKEDLLVFMEMYNYRIQQKVAEGIFWTIFVVQLIYSVIYFCIAGTAMYTKLPKQYQLFANWSLAGIVGLVFLAYVDKFNLLIFFLRLLAYIYSRFLQGLTASLLLLPPLPSTA